MTTAQSNTLLMGLAIVALVLAQGGSAPQAVQALYSGTTGRATGTISGGANYTSAPSVSDAQLISLGTSAVSALPSFISGIENLV